MEVRVPRGPNIGDAEKLGQGHENHRNVGGSSRPRTFFGSIAGANELTAVPEYPYTS
jgi:hypothetical protein